MKQLSTLLPKLTAICLALLLLLLAAHCIDIYYFQDTTATQLFTYEDVGERLKSLFPLATICCMLVILSFVFPKTNTAKHQDKHATCQHQQDYSKSSINDRPLLVIRAILLLIAVGFIFCGVFNGGLYDVFVKAINICTECIGLG